MKKQIDIIVALKRIAADNDGVLLPEEVVASARPVSSPLHSRFEWCNSKAAHEYRLWQARHLIRVCVETIPQSNKPCEVFVSLTPDRVREDGGYRVQTEVLSDKDLRAQLLADAFADLDLIRLKYSRLQELAGVFAAIRKIKR